MPLYKFNMKTGDGHNAKLAGYVYEISDEYARILNEERKGRCEQWKGPEVQSGTDVSGTAPVPPASKDHLESGKGEGAPSTLKGDAWRSKGLAKGRLGSGA